MYSARQVLVFSPPLPPIICVRIAAPPPCQEKNSILSGKRLCFVSSMLCSGVKQTVEDNCILVHSNLKMLEIPFQRPKIKKLFWEACPPPPRERFFMYELSSLLGTLAPLSGSSWRHHCIGGLGKFRLVKGMGLTFSFFVNVNFYLAVFY